MLGRMRHISPTRRSLCDMTAGQRVLASQCNADSGGVRLLRLAAACVRTLSQAMMLAIVILGNVLPLVSWSGEEQ